MTLVVRHLCAKVLYAHVVLTLDVLGRILHHCVSERTDQGGRAPLIPREDASIAGFAQPPSDWVLQTGRARRRLKKEGAVPSRSSGPRRPKEATVTL